MTVRIEFDTSKLKAITKGELKKQMRFATAYALTKTAYDARASVQRKLPQWLNIRKQFLPRSVVVEKATKDNPVALVGFLERAHLAPLLERGGKRKPLRSRSIAVPQGAKSRTGRVTKAKRPAALLAKGGFIATINGTKGIWMEVGGKRRRRLKLMYVFERTTQYEPNKIHFAEAVHTTARATFKKRLVDALHYSLQTMKR